MGIAISIAILLLCIAVIIGVLAYYFGIIGGPSGVIDESIKSIVASQRNTKTYSSSIPTKKTILEVAAKEEKVKKVVNSRLTLQKRLRYAQWKISPLTYYLLVISISLLCFFVVRIRFNALLQIMSLLVGPIFMRWLLATAVHKRFQAFDKDYPSFLLSLVGLLKTGMNTIQALEAAAEGLEENSLVRYEVLLMIERLKLGIQEEQSIGAFGEDIYHEEIELFVQALLLSSKVGGNLSNTLDRLARQVRKRQYFRQSAYQAVGMQRGSIWIIIIILMLIMTYMYFVSPELVVGAWKDEVGWQVWQFGIVVILIGLFWIRQVTKIRV